MTTAWNDSAAHRFRGLLVRAALISALLIALIATSGVALARDNAPDIRGTWQASSEVHIEGDGIPFVVEDTHESVTLVVTDIEQHVFRGYFDFQVTMEGKTEDKILHFVGLFRGDDEFVLRTKLGTLVFGEVDGDSMSIDYLAFRSAHSAGSYELQRVSK